MINEGMQTLGSVRSVIRELFEYGRKRKAEIGEENVFDFSLGNPSIPAPQKVTDTLRVLLSQDPVSLHGYTSAQGALPVRKAMAESINRRFGRNMTPERVPKVTHTLRRICL